MRFYINGVQVGSSVAANVSVNSNAAWEFRIGNYSNNTTRYWNGYISGFRAVPNTAVYTSAFVPPTAPPTAITNTQLLLNFTNAGIVDSTAKNVLETVGNAQISTAVSKFGGSSMYFDGTGDYLFSPVSQNFSFPGDFTIEGWMNTSTTSTEGGAYSHRAG
jgi:hypothetical protein